jgi:16S rRNA (guanine527-N7)-methyltransferase
MRLTASGAAEILKKGLYELGLFASDQRINAFITYLSELKKWNKAYNLTGIRDDEDIIVKHFFDSLLYLKPLPDSEIRVADIGSGAGFPGVPIAIIRPETEMYLIEPSGKKSAFLRHIIWLLGLKRVHVVEKRIEEVKADQDLSAPVDIAVTRALFGIGEFVKKTMHILGHKGVCVLNKGPKVKGEIESLSGIQTEILSITLPLAGIVRYIVVARLNHSQ